VVFGNFLDEQRSAARGTTLARNSAAKARNKIRTDEWFRRIRSCTESKKRRAHSSWGLHQNRRLVPHLATFMGNRTAPGRAAAVPVTWGWCRSLRQRCRMRLWRSDRQYSQKEHDSNNSVNHLFHQARPISGDSPSCNALSSSQLRICRPGLGPKSRRRSLELTFERTIEGSFRFVSHFGRDLRNRVIG